MFGLSNFKRLSKASAPPLFLYLWNLIKNQKGRFLSIFVLDSLAWPLDTVLWPFILRWIIDIFVKYDQTRALAWPVLKAPILLVLALVAFVEVASRTMGFIMAKAMPALQRSVRLSMFDHIQHHSPKYFNDKFAGNLSNRITDMTSQVEVLLNELFWPIIPALSTCILGAVVLWFVRPFFSFLLMGWLVIHSMICIFFSRRIDTLEHIHAQARSSLMGRIVDSLTNNFAVNLFYRFNFEKQKVQSYQKKEEEANKKARTSIEKMRVVLSAIYFFIIIIGIFGALIYSWLQGKITTGEVVQVFTTLWSFAMIIWNLGTALPLVFQSYGILKQAYEAMEDPSDLGDLTQAKELKVSKGKIVLKDITFAYGSKPLFENLNLTIDAGEKVGIVGYTGAGKSTLINLILRFHLLTKGEIEIDGQNIKEVTLASLRRQISLIPQNPILFHRSLFENIAYGKHEASFNEVLQASKSSHCHEFISQIHRQYDAKVGERGTKLSGGEKQRIAIARSLLINTPILILDEATSALDSLTEYYVGECLKNEMTGKTILSIAHRLSTLSQMDRIIVLEQGQIVEEGSPIIYIKSNGSNYCT